MFSLLTNASAMTALRSLQATRKELDTAERQMATGLRVAEASDNPAYWSIATTMRAQLSAYGATQDALDLSAASLDVAQAGIKSVLSNLNGLQQDMVTASQPGTDLAAIQQDIAARQTGIRDALGNSNFNGVSQLSVNTGFTSNGVVYDALTLDVGAMSRTGIQALAQDFAQVIRQATDSGVEIGSRRNRTAMIRDYYGTLIDATTSGIGALVDADMNVVATRIQALKTQQQLGIMALSIANDSSKLVLKLFGA